MPDLVIGTTTFYPEENDIRVGLASKTIESARSRSFDIIIVDGGSPKTVVDHFVSLGAEVYPEFVSAKSGQLGPGRRQCLKLAADVAGDRGCVIWMEPEKHHLISWLKDIAKPVLSGEVEMVIPRRESMETYPLTQELAEPLGNIILEDISGVSMDTWFGPMALSIGALKFFLEYQGDYGDRWDATHVPRLRVIAEGLRWKELRVRYNHPREQTDQEFGDPYFDWKRITQLYNMIPAFWMEAYRLRLTDREPPPDIRKMFEA